MAREIVSSKDREPETHYYIAYASAFDIHQMTTQPQLIVHISSPQFFRPCNILGTEFRFTRCKPEHIFGITEVWLDKNEKIKVSDLERTLIDGLKHPEKCGGLSEVAKAFVIKHHLINPQKLIDYAMQLNVGVVYRRLGYLMELSDIGLRVYQDLLKTKLTKTYQLLDPELAHEGKYLSKWRLILNVPEKELLTIGET